MTSSESSGTKEAWTSGQAVARRKALTGAGMERPVAETLVDLLDEQAAPMMTRAEADARFSAMLDRQDMAKAEADARFAAMLERHDAQRAQDRAEINARFAEFRGDLDARFGQVDARFGQVDARFGEINGRFGEIEGRFGEIEGRFGEIEGRFGEIKADIEKLRADLTWRTLLIVGGLLAATTTLNRLLG